MTRNWQPPLITKSLLSARSTFSHVRVGLNFRLTNMQAALGLAQLERMDQIVAGKRWMGRNTRSACKESWIAASREEPWARSVYWMYGVVCRMIRDG
jgi:perosamine synthetase